MDPCFTRVEALRYRSLRYVSQALSNFHVLVGANASGKSTFLDVLALVRDLVQAGATSAVEGDVRQGIAHRAPDGRQLVWMNEGTRIELAIETSVPADRRDRLKNGAGERCRYEIALDVGGPLAIVGETMWLKPADEPAPASRQRELFPESKQPPLSLVQPPRKHAATGWKKVLSRSEEPDRVTFSSETTGWTNPFRLGTQKTALSSLPEDEERFPVATWFRRFLLEGVQRLVLSSEAMRRPSPPSRVSGYLADGSNLPQVVHRLEASCPDRVCEWMRHAREALPDLEGIETREREEDRHRYLVLRYRSGLEAPSWLVSDGTLRLLALTLLAYVPDLSGVYLVEEPENGIHPRAVETVMQSLRSVYGAQVLVATHSPVIVSQAELHQILCFGRTLDGATDIVVGTEHPHLRKWKGAVDLGTMLASGVLG
jgi:predicted ATPase